MHIKRRAYGPALIFFIALIAGTGAARIDFVRGYWADEFWTLFMTGHGVGFAQAFSSRWMQDVHPPIYNACAWLFSGVFGNSVPVDRLFNIVPLAITAALFATRRAAGPSARSFTIAIALSMFAIPDFQRYMSEARSYFFVICAAAVSVWSAYETFDKPQPISKTPGLAVIVFLASSLWILLHYVNGLIGCAFAISCAAVHTHQRRFDWAALFLGLVILAFAMWLISFHAEQSVFALQAKPTPNPSGAIDCVLIFSEMAWACLRANPVLSAMAIWTMFRSRPHPAYLWALLSTLVLSVVALAAFNWLRPTLIPRYVLSAQLVMIAGIALLAAESLSRRRAILLLAASWTLLVVAKHGWFSKPEENWFGTGRVIASIVRDCPASRVHMARDPRLGRVVANLPPPHAAEVRALSYQTIASKFGFTIAGEAPAIAGACPTLIWAEHVGTPDIAPSIIAQTEHLDASRIAFAKEFKGYSGVVFAFWPRRGSAYQNPYPGRGSP